MRYLLDTDVIIYWLKGNVGIEERVMAEGLENIGFSIIPKAELYFGAYNSKRIENNLKNIDELSVRIKLLPLNNDAAETFGKLKAERKRTGNIITDADIMVASIAFANDLTLITNNLRHFERISDLKIENWVATKDGCA